jgi:hypothetical protein
MMRIVFALLAVFFSSTALAECYQVFSPSDTLVWQGTQPPVAIDVPSINEAIKKRFPGGHLRIINDPTARCFAFDAARLESDEPMIKSIDLPE